MLEEKTNSLSENEDASASETAVKKGFSQKLKEVAAAIPTVCKIIFAVGVLALLIHLACVIFPAFADFVTKYVGAGPRFLLAKISGVVPFSLAEMTIILLPLLLVFLVVKGIKAVNSNKENVYLRYICALISLIVVFYSLFVFTLGSAYQGTTLYEKLGVEEKTYENSDALLELAGYLRDNANECAEEIDFSSSKGSVMPYSRDKLNSLLNDAAVKASQKYDFISPLRSNVKDVILSTPMTYTHISGVYTYYTGEANLNTNFPDYTLPYTMAHEMSHQRGIAREEEANFVAYLICMESDDNYIRYSAYVNLLEYVQSALYKSDPEAYSTFYRTLGDKIIVEYLAYDEFFDEYRVSVASDVSGAINNAYLQSQGQTAGTQSYSLVVGLALAYIDY